MLNPIALYLMTHFGTYYLYILVCPLVIGGIVISILGFLYHQPFRKLGIYLSVFAGIYVSYGCLIVGLPYWSMLIAGPATYFFCRGQMSVLDKMMDKLIDISKRKK